VPDYIARDHSDIDVHDSDLPAGQLVCHGSQTIGAPKPSMKRPPSFGMSLLQQLFILATTPFVSK
jgi:hypothetical protein